MKNLLTVLKKLGKKMTGDDIAGTNLVTVVDDIANKYTGGGGGGGGDKGWSIEETELFSDTLTTEGDESGLYSSELAYDEIINLDTITVAFDGTEYECTRIDAFDSYYYGGFTEQGPVFTEYPFAIQSNESVNQVFTETANTHTIAIFGDTIVTSSDFSVAVGKCLPTLKVKLGKTTFQDVSDAVNEGLFVYGWDDDNGRMFYALSTGEDTGKSEYYLVALTQGIGTTSLTTETFVASSPDSPLCVK